MPYFVRFIISLLLLVFLAKSIVGNSLQTFKNTPQVLLIDENQENEQSDDIKDFKFLDICLKTNSIFTTITLFELNKTNESIDFYNNSLLNGFLNSSFKPPCS